MLPSLASCSLRFLLLLLALLGPATSHGACSNTFITTHRGKISMQDTIDKWKTVIAEWQDGYQHHELVTLEVSGEPCGGMLGAWTFQLRAHSTDFAVFKQVILENEFHFVHTLFGDTPPKSIIDLGGNCGMASAFMGTKFPTARVVLVEPMITNFLTAQLNTFSIGNVFQEHAAIWGHLGHIEISGNIFGTQTENQNEWAITVKEVPKADRLAVKNILPGITIPYLMQKYHFTTVDFVKIDIEGAEVSLFAAENKPKEWLERVRCFSIEIHSWAADFPKTWQASVFVPLVTSLGFSNTVSSGELSIWCKSSKSAQAGGGWK